jgi:hypothetical protein
MGCGDDQSSFYRVAIESLSSQSLASTCFREGQAPAPNSDKTTNVFDLVHWTIWDGGNDQLYLTAGPIHYTLGQAKPIELEAGVISGINHDGEYIFAVERVRAEIFTEITTASAGYIMTELGETLQGSLSLRSKCVGVDCGDTPNCSTALRFFGRRIDTEHRSTYTP